MEGRARSNEIHDPNLVDTFLAMVDATALALERGDSRAAANVLAAFEWALDAQVDTQIELESSTQLHRHAHQVLQALQRS